VELFSDIPADCGGGGGGKSANLPDVEFRRRLPQPEISGPEVMPPLADTVSFVHHQDFRRAAAQKIFEKIHAEPFRGHIKELQISIFSPFKDLPLLLKWNHAVDAPGRDPPGIERIHLVFHQSDQGGCNNTVPGCHEHRELIAQRLSRPRGHNDAEFLSGGDPFYDILLIIEKTVIAEVVLQSIKSFRHKTIFIS
jgi:hypothetical protein